MGGGCHAACFLRAYAGAPVTRTLRPSLLRSGERPCDTLRALPENTAHQPTHPQPRRDRRIPRIPIHAEVHISSTAAPGIQARKDGIARSDIRVSEAKRGRVPCRNEGEYRLPSIEHQSKGNIYTSSPAKSFQREHKNPADSKESAGSSKSAPPGTRTQNPLIKSQLLCQLS